jgi:hypothetical protein
MSRTEDGPDLHIMTAAVTGLSQKYVKIKDVVCLFILQHHHYTASVSDMYSNEPEFDGGGTRIDEDDDEIYSYNQESHIDLNNTARTCLDLLDDIVFNHGAFKEIGTTSRLCIRTLRYEMAQFMLTRKEVGTFRTWL